MIPGEKERQLSTTVAVHADALPSRARATSGFTQCQRQPPMISEGTAMEDIGQVAAIENRVISAAREACARCSRQVGRHVVYRTWAASDSPQRRHRLTHLPLSWSDNIPP